MQSTSRFHLYGLLAFVTITAVFCQEDRTLLQGESGTDVVLAVLSKLEYSNVFPSSSDMREIIFMQRMAFVETREGMHPPRFPPLGGEDGGIWNVKPSLFNLTLTADSILLGNIAQSPLLNFVEWTEQSRVNLSRPLYSGLAIRIYLSGLQDVPAPGTSSAQDQQNFWVRHFHPENAQEISNMNIWINEISELGENEGCTFTTDTVFVLDASGSIGSANFQEVRTFTRDFADVLLRNDSDTSNNKIGIVLFQSSASITRALNSSIISRKDLLNVIETIPYTGGGTNTAAGLEVMRTQEWRDQISTVRLAIVLTDGRSNDFTATINAARSVHDHTPSILVFAIGVGSGPNMEELREIASGPEFVASLASFDHSLFSSTVASFSYRICNTVSQNISTNTSQAGAIEGNTTVRISYEAPAEEGITLQLCAHSGTLVLYASITIPNPSAALYDWRIEVEAVPHYVACSATFFNLTVPAEDESGRMITLFVSLKGEALMNNFTLKSDEGFVPDVNECEEDHPCHVDGQCVNIFGGFYCTCGERFNGDGVLNCTDVDECVERDPCKLNEECFNTHGGYNCTLIPQDPKVVIITVCTTLGGAMLCFCTILIIVFSVLYRRSEKTGKMTRSTSVLQLIPDDNEQQDNVPIEIEEHLFDPNAANKNPPQYDDVVMKYHRNVEPEIERRISILHSTRDGSEKKDEDQKITFIDDIDLEEGYEEMGGKEVEEIYDEIDPDYVPRKSKAPRPTYINTEGPQDYVLHEPRPTYINTAGPQEYEEYVKIEDGGKKQRSLSKAEEEDKFKYSGKVKTDIQRRISILQGTDDKK